MGRKVEGREGLGGEKKRGATEGERSESGGGSWVGQCEASETGSLRRSRMAPLDRPGVT